jgi:hypothetical protein
MLTKAQEVDVEVGAGGRGEEKHGCRQLFI